MPESKNFCYGYVVVVECGCKGEVVTAQNYIKKLNHNPQLSKQFEHLINLEKEEINHVAQ